MGELPSGVVTFLFTDIVGSTRLWSEHPAAMDSDLASHDRLLRSAIDAEDGYVFSTAGDGFAAAFSTAEQAVAAAIGAQETLAEEDWGVPDGVAVRIGIHTGQAVERGADYFGPTLNAAARLMAAAHGGQIVLSEQAHVLGGGVPTIDLGEHRLRDISEAVRVHQVVVPGLPSEFPPLRSLAAFTSTLPQNRSSFVGRADEIGRLGRLLVDHRLVTITGVGGAGKTRLAIEVAAADQDHYPDGVFFVDLSSTDQPDEIETAVMVGIRLGVTDPSRLRAEIGRFLAERTVLLVLDNCEHLLDAAADLVDDLLGAAPRLSVLATSREALEVEGERTFRAPSLDSEGAGLRLFVDRATSVYDQFEINDANRETVVELCRRLDGLPLAIELAASRVRTFAPAELLDHLDERLTLLRAGRRRGVLQRQRTLEAAIGWSHDLLDDDEQAFFRRLAVFGGPFVFDVLPIVTDFAEPVARELLESLVAKSLVVPMAIDADQMAFRLLETVRAYAGQQLAASDEVTEVADRHLDAYRVYSAPGDEPFVGLWSESRAQRAQVADLWAAADRAVVVGRPRDAADILTGVSVALVGSRENFIEALQRQIHLAERHLADLDMARRARLLGVISMGRMTAGLITESILGAQSDLARCDAALTEDKALLIINRGIFLAATDPAAGLVWTQDAIDDLGDSPLAEVARQNFMYMKAACLAALRRYDEACRSAIGSFDERDTFHRDLGLATLLWAAHLGEINPPGDLLHIASRLPAGEGGWRMSPIIAAAMWSGEPSEIASTLTEIAKGALSGRLPGEEAEFLVAFARLAHLGGDDERANELLEFTTTRTPWLNFVMTETMGVIQGWSDEEWDKRRLTEVLARADPQREALIRDRAPEVLSAEMARWA